MVKNSGGCRTKGLARKLVNAPVSDRVRKIEEEGECYAIVSKMLGNGMCLVNILQDDNILPNIVCHIRGKFRGRNKKANLVVIGSFLIVGLRTWEHNINACDLVYIINQPNSLNISPILFNSIYSINHTIDSNSDILEFSNISHSTTTTTTLPTTPLIINDHIDFDDI
jgi:translation initiation factor IF-1